MKNSLINLSLLVMVFVLTGCATSGKKQNCANYVDQNVAPAAQAAEQVTPPETAAPAAEETVTDAVESAEEVIPRAVLK